MVLKRLAYGVIIGIMVCMAAMCAGYAQALPLQLVISNEKAFSPEEARVALATNDGAAIFYTLDGSIPNENSLPYEGQLVLSADSMGDAVVLRAVAYRGGEASDIVTQTYFLMPEVENRFDTLVFSLSTAPENLYSEERGIFVHIEQRGRESERDVYVEVFTPDGERVLAQAAGMRVHGNASRGMGTKSIKLIARKDYDPQRGKFTYDFFPDDYTLDGRYGSIDKYDAIVLRNGANDRNGGVIRNELAYELARDAGFETVAPVRPAAVYLNGEYYGFAYINGVVDDNYLEKLYAAPERAFQVVGNGEVALETDDEDARIALEYINDFEYEKLGDDAVFAQLESALDVDNLLLYYALEIYMANGDWPNNNLKRWRYVGEEALETADNPALDGRWRYIMYDMDYTLGSTDEETYLYMLGNVVSGFECGGLFSRILVRNDTTEKFMNIMCDLMYETMSVENVQLVLDRVYSQAANEISYAITHGKYDPGVSVDTIERQHANKWILSGSGLNTWRKTW